LLFVRDDWAEDHHDIELMEAGRTLTKVRLPEGVAGIARLHAIIAEQLARTPMGPRCGSGPRPTAARGWPRCSRLDTPCTRWIRCRRVGTGIVYPSPCLTTPRLRLVRPATIQ